MLLTRPGLHAERQVLHVHIEDPALPGSNRPDNTHVPVLNVAGYTTTAAIKTPGPLQDEGVPPSSGPIQTPRNSTFEAQSRAVALRSTRPAIPSASHLHPTARRGDPDWRVLYIEWETGASGESRTCRSDRQPAAARTTSKAKSLSHHSRSETNTPARATVSENGRYRISRRTKSVRSSWAAEGNLGVTAFRNPHRLNWAVDPPPREQSAHRQLRRLHTWETYTSCQRGELRLRRARRQTSC